MAGSLPTLVFDHRVEYVSGRFFSLHRPGKSTHADVLYFCRASDVTTCVTGSSYETRVRDARELYTTELHDAVDHRILALPHDGGSSTEFLRTRLSQVVASVERLQSERAGWYDDRRVLENAFTEEIERRMEGGALLDPMGAGSEPYAHGRAADLRRVWAAEFDALVEGVHEHVRLFGQGDPNLDALLPLLCKLYGFDGWAAAREADQHPLLLTYTVEYAFLQTQHAHQTLMRPFSLLRHTAWLHEYTASVTEVVRMLRRQEAPDEGRLAVKRWAVERRPDTPRARVQDLLACSVFVFLHSAFLGRHEILGSLFHRTVPTHHEWATQWAAHMAACTAWVNLWMDEYLGLKASFAAVLKFYQADADSLEARLDALCVQHTHLLDTLRALVG